MTGLGGAGWQLLRDSSLLPGLAALNTEASCPTDTVGQGGIMYVLFLNLGLRLGITHMVHLDVRHIALLCLAQDLQLIFLDGTGTVSLGLFPSHDRYSQGLSFELKTIEAVLYTVV